MQTESGIDWDTLAAEVAERIHDELFEAHRGITESRHGGVLAVFGNDSYSKDPRAKREVEAARRCIEDGGGTVLGFGTCGEGYSWVLLYRAHNLSPDKVVDALWDAWLGDSPPDDDGTFRKVQESVADSAILKDVLAAGPSDVVHHN